MNPFSTDRYPGEPRILFIGLAHSSHTAAWIALLHEARLNLRLFAVPGSGLPPPDWGIPSWHCGATARFAPGGVALPYVRFIDAADAAPSTQHGPTHGPAPNARRDPERWLANILQEWQPDIIHTLGLFDHQGGEFFARTRERFPIGHIGRWVLQLRGGSDITLRRHDPACAARISASFADCDQIITDNLLNIDYATALGFGSRIASISPIPGTGGLVLPAADSLRAPSLRARIILWPKAYESQWSLGEPVVLALKRAWPRIAPCTLIATATDDAIRARLDALPPPIRSQSRVESRIPRDELLALLRDARVLLAPSLVDGVPNVLYEAMAYGACPIVSPLETITPLVREPDNVLFAANADVHGLASALVRGMTDDLSCDVMARNNHVVVGRVANRARNALRVTAYYRALAAAPRAAG